MTTDKGPDKILDPEVIETIEDGLRAHRDAHGRRQLADPSAARRDVELANSLEADLDNVHRLNTGVKPAEKMPGGMINAGNKNVKVGPGGHHSVDDGLDDEA